LKVLRVRRPDGDRDDTDVEAAVECSNEVHARRVDQGDVVSGVKTALEEHANVIVVEM
jgi:hypothetical protein